jgi:DNA-binding LytR/AlgR family response regulator
MKAYHIGIPEEISQKVIRVELAEDNSYVKIVYSDKKDVWMGKTLTGNFGEQEIHFLIIEIQFINRVKGCTMVHTCKGEFIIDERITDVLKKLDSQIFEQISQSIIVNVHYLHKVYRKKVEVKERGKIVTLNVGPKFQKEHSKRHNLSPGGRR